MIYKKTMKINSGESYPNSRALGGTFTSHDSCVRRQRSRLQMHLANTAAFAFRIHILGGKNGVRVEHIWHVSNTHKTNGWDSISGWWCVCVYMWCLSFEQMWCLCWLRVMVFVFMCQSFESSTTPQEVCVKYCKGGDSDGVGSCEVMSYIVRVGG